MSDGHPSFQVANYGPLYRLTDAGPFQVRPAMTRDEYLEHLRRQIEAKAHAVGEGFKFTKLPQPSTDFIATRLRWATILQTVAGAWRWEISGGRGHISRVVVQEPPDSKRLNIEIRVGL
jgi:hypothetical protein